MPRLHLTYLCVVASFFSFGQNNLKKYLEFAKEQYDKGDFYYALEYYNKAMELDSNTIDILWQVAETYRAYKDYRKAEYYYEKVYDREEAGIYPSSLLYLGLMQKQNGKYEAALETFKKAKKKYYKDKKSYLYLKSKQEIESTLWAISNKNDELKVDFASLPDEINSPDSEFGHGIHDGQLLFSSLRADSMSSNEEVYSKSYRTKLYASRIDLPLLNYQPGELLPLSGEVESTGNGTFSLDGKRFYFSSCKEDGYNYTCKILVATYENGKWLSPDTLGEIINTVNANTTMPCIAELDGVETLIFASDREDTEGGLDLFYSKIKDGNQYSKPRSIKTLNSPDNEVTPWWDPKKKRLYFSSSWHEGFGGLDVFYSDYSNGQFTAPKNGGIPVNSSANDLYYFQFADTLFVTSNRIGVRYSKNPTCCSDIFVMKPPVIVQPPTAIETLFELNKRLPVTLYFHNDRPDPDSRNVVTKLDYMETYDSYTILLEEYKKEYSKGLSGERAEEAKEDIETFFIEYVDKGVSDLEHFRDLLIAELQKGAKIEVTIKGFASPLAKTDYNVNLTKRRISSLINYLRKFNAGEFIPYLENTAKNGGRLVFKEVPFGEYTANQLISDNPNDVQNSVYSRAAAMERKIEIQSVNYLEENDKFPLKSEFPVVDGGPVSTGTSIRASYTVKNRSAEKVTIDQVTGSDVNMRIHSNLNVLEPGQEMRIDLELPTANFKGHNMEYITVECANCDGKLELYVTFEVKEN